MLGSNRDPRRINSFLSDLGVLWGTQCPQWRFGQLIENVMEYIRSESENPFYLEENAFREYIERYFSLNEKPWGLERTLMDNSVNVNDVKINERCIKKAERILVDNGIEPDEAYIVLQAVGYALLDIELYPEL